MIFLLILSLMINVALGFATINLLKQNETFEEFFETIHQQLSDVLTQIRTVDINGSFEADDEVGVVFKGIHTMIESLNTFTMDSDAKA